MTTYKDCKDGGHDCWVTSDHHLPALSSEEKEMIMGGTALKIWFKRS